MDFTNKNGLISPKGPAGAKFAIDRDYCSNTPKALHNLAQRSATLGKDARKWIRKQY
ncbi:MAG: hypothetical protein HQK57_11900 [Deltaproteobacteria bacterium]|nr:hypothetical protein [Deltaproteobacteria bacterium]MBF0527554.1 hypothetical protein [Deltaproteobacteria bacterium]